MSPTKRSNEELLFSGGREHDDVNDEDSNDELPLPMMMGSSPKRLRGGGRGDDENDVNDAIDDFMDGPEEEVDHYIPIDTEEDATAAALDLHDDVIAKSRSKWVRPPLESKPDNQNDLNIQWLDIDMVAGDPLKRNPNASQTRVVGNTNGQQVPIIRVYGVNEGGHSVTVFIHGFTPYAYFALPANVQASLFTNDLKTKIRQTLDGRLKSSARGQSTLQEYVLGVEYLPHHRSIMGYETPHTQFLKVYCGMPTLIPTLKRIMEEGVELDIPGHPGTKTYPAFECNVPFVLRYMIDQDITGAGWLTFPKGTYRVRPENDKKTHCQVSKYRCLIFEEDKLAACFLFSLQFDN
jgi:hypothetical protein